MSKPEHVVSERTRIALAAVVAIAQKPPPAPMSRSAIIAALGLANERTLELDLQALVRAGVLHSTRGPAGGYDLAVSATSLKVGVITRVVNELRQGRLWVLPPLVTDIVDPMLAYPTQRFAEMLDGITVADLCYRSDALREAAQ